MDKNIKLLIRRTTAERLHGLKALGDSYDDVIVRLLDGSKERKGEER